MQDSLGTEIQVGDLISYASSRRHATLLFYEVIAAEANKIVVLNITNWIPRYRCVDGNIIPRILAKNTRVDANSPSQYISDKINDYARHNLSKPSRSSISIKENMLVINEKKGMFREYYRQKERFW